MQMAENVDQRRRLWIRGLAALVVLVAAAVAVLLQLDGDPDGAAPAAGEPAAAGAGEQGLPEQLAARVVEILEEASLAEHADHGHHFDEAASGIVCAAEAFGFDPPEATSVDQVRTVYAHHMCAEVGPDLVWPDAIRAAGPLAVQLTDPPAVLLPEALPAGEGALYADRIRALIPERYHAEALASEGFADSAVAEQLRTRFEAAQSTL
jgi:hypothetical protein